MNQAFKQNITGQANAIVQKSLKDLHAVWGDVWSTLVDMGYKPGDDISEVLLHLVSEIGDEYKLTDADDILLNRIWEVAETYITKEAPNVIEY